MSLVTIKHNSNDQSMKRVCELNQGRSKKIDIRKFRKPNLHCEGFRCGIPHTLN